MHMERACVLTNYAMQRMHKISLFFLRRPVRSLPLPGSIPAVVCTVRFRQWCALCRGLVVLPGELEMDGAHPDVIVDEDSTEDQNHQVEIYMELFW